MDEGRGSPGDYQVKISGRKNLEEETRKDFFFNHWLGNK